MKKSGNSLLKNLERILLFLVNSKTKNNDIDESAIIIINTYFFIKKKKDNFKHTISNKRCKQLNKAHYSKLTRKYLSSIFKKSEFQNLKILLIKLENENSTEIFLSKKEIDLFRIFLLDLFFKIIKKKNFSKNNHFIYFCLSVLKDLITSFLKKSIKKNQIKIIDECLNQIDQFIIKTEDDLSTLREYYFKVMILKSFFINSVQTFKKLISEFLMFTKSSFSDRKLKEVKDLVIVLLKKKKSQRFDTVSIDSEFKNKKFQNVELSITNKINFNSSIKAHFNQKSIQNKANLSNISLSNFRINQMNTRVNSNTNYLKENYLSNNSKIEPSKKLFCMLIPEDEIELKKILMRLTHKSKQNKEDFRIRDSILTKFFH